jgi:hypothetical protein
MKRLIASKYLSVALVVAALAAAGSAPVFAQSRSHYGSLLPHYFDGAGELIWGSWAPPAADQKRANPPHRLYLYVKPDSARARVR